MSVRSSRLVRFTSAVPVFCPCSKEEFETPAADRAPAIFSFYLVGSALYSDAVFRGYRFGVLYLPGGE